MQSALVVGTLVAISIQLVALVDGQNASNTPKWPTTCVDRISNKELVCTYFPISYHVCREYPKLIYCPMQWECNDYSRANLAAGITGFCNFCFESVNKTHPHKKVCYREKQTIFQVPQEVREEVRDCPSVFSYILGGIAAIIIIASLLIALCAVVYRQKPNVIHSRKSLTSAERRSSQASHLPSTSSSPYSYREQPPSTPRSPLSDAPYQHSEAFQHAESVLHTAPKSTSRRSPPHHPLPYLHR